MHLAIHNSKLSFRGEWLTREQILNVLGEERWELVSVIADQQEKFEAFFFKRPLDEAA